MGRGGPTVRPARSSDLNSLCYYLWGRVVSIAYALEASEV